jgi:hypothetical protein
MRAILALALLHLSGVVKYVSLVMDSLSMMVTRGSAISDFPKWPLFHTHSTKFFTKPPQH